MWQAQHFGYLHRHFAWQAQHFRHVELRVFTNRRIALSGLRPVVTLNTPHFALHTQTLHLHLTLTLYTLHCPLHTPHSTLYTLHPTPYTPHLKLPTPHFTLHTLNCPLHTPHFTLYTSHSTLYTPHFTLYTLHFTLYTPFLFSQNYNSGVRYHTCEHSGSWA